MDTTLRSSIVEKPMLHEWVDIFYFNDLISADFSDFMKPSFTLRSAEEITRTKKYNDTNE